MSVTRLQILILLNVSETRYTRRFDDVEKFFKTRDQRIVWVGWVVGYFFFLTNHGPSVAAISSDAHQSDSVPMGKLVM